MSRYISKRNYVVSETCGEAILAPLCSGAADMGKILALNETGALMVRLMEQGLGVEDMCSAIMSEYDVTDVEVVRADVLRFAGTMVEKGFFELEE